MRLTVVFAFAAGQQQGWVESHTDPNQRPGWMGHCAGRRSLLRPGAACMPPLNKAYMPLYVTACMPLAILACMPLFIAVCTPSSITAFLSLLIAFVRHCTHAFAHHCMHAFVRHSLLPCLPLCASLLCITELVKPHTTLCHWSNLHFDCPRVCWCHGLLTQLDPVLLDSCSFSALLTYHNAHTHACTISLNTSPSTQAVAHLDCLSVWS